MMALGVAQLLAALGVARSHARPRTPDDNPSSESQFKTTKGHPTFPESFADLEDARSWVRSFVAWYNHHHHHRNLGLLTPATVHHGRTAVVVAIRQQALDAAYQAHPERFVRGRPQPPTFPAVVGINLPATAGQPALREPAVA